MMTSDGGELTVNLGLWGAALSGKTSFIAAVDHAAQTLRERFPSAQLRVTAAGDDQNTNALFLQYQDGLSHGRFPRPTEDDKVPSFSLQVSGDIPDSMLGNGVPSEVSSTQSVSLTISLRDYPGKAFLVDSIFADVGEFLAGCDGIILLFDPVRETEAGDNSSFILRPLAELDQRMAKSGKRVSLAGASYRLPQWLAICITKLDHPLVYEQVKAALVETGVDELITHGTAALPQSLQGALGASQFVDNVSRFFLPSRTRFFLTSTIGLYVSPGATAPVAHDYVNTVETYGGPRIRGQCRPINVIEPLIWLNQQIRG
jgi:hypothetical protein